MKCIIRLGYLFGEWIITWKPTSWPSSYYINRHNSYGTQLGSPCHDLLLFLVGAYSFQVATNVFPSLENAYFFQLRNGWCSENDVIFVAALYQVQNPFDIALYVMEWWSSNSMHISYFELFSIVWSSPFDPWSLSHFFWTLIFRRGVRMGLCLNIRKVR